jgi:predicted AlkP superfamily pyrophosphatase or phosphodiesterase
MRLLGLALICLWSVNLSAQKASNNNTKPKLVIGIVVDQMRWDIVNRYSSFLKTRNGFLKLANDGASCNYTLIPYVHTVTACGHAAIYTGSVPAIHGIVGNNWFNNLTERTEYCVDDKSVNTLGSKNTSAGQMSPKNLWTTTIGDELKLSNNFQSKVIGISLKDRGAILPAGHTANAAYWYDSETGNMVSSSYYQKQMPQWANSFNDLHKVDSFYKQGWTLSLPKEVYEKNCDADENAYETGFYDEKIKINFPFDLTKLIGKDYKRLFSIPQGNNLVVDFAKEAIKNEKLGEDSITDILTLSFSTPDYIGHNFGPYSWESLDGYVKLDEVLADFFDYLDMKIGKDNYTLFLTADHAIAPIPGFAKKNKLPADYYVSADISKDLNNLLASNNLKKELISSVYESTIYYNHKLMDSLHITDAQLTQLITKFLESKPTVLQVVNNRNAALAPLPQLIREMLLNGYTPQRSGDLTVLLKSGVIDGYPTGASHGVFYNYDSHIPLYFYGKGIKKGNVNSMNYMTDIAPTISTLLGIQMPSGSIGKPILEVLK